MFAFLIWDAQERVLFGARDPFGIKPLFVASGPAGAAFGSEKKSLLELTGALGLADGTAVALDEAALQHYLILQYVPEPATMHRTVRRIESGCSFTLRPGGEIEQDRYFRPAFTDTGRTGPPAYAAVADVLRDSVAKHMRADVTVGAFLSGGIDSTAIAALAKEHNPDLITFTTGFEREGYSEVDVAVESAAAIGVRHVVRTVKPDEMMDALPLIVWYLDDPVADPALVPLWFIAREARQHVKVVLSGEGADELFGGYTIYREPLSLAPFETGARERCAGCSATAVAPGCRTACEARTCCAAAPCRWSSATTAMRGSSATTSWPACCAATTRVAGTSTSPPRTTRSRPAGTRWPGCSTSTCSPGCAATSWSRRTR